MDRFADVLFRHSRLILVGWVLLSLVGAGFAAGLEGRAVPGGEASASSQGEAVARELSSSGVSSLFLVVTGPAAAPDTDGARALESIRATAAGVPGVQEVAPLPLPPAAPGSGPVAVLGVTAAGGVDGSIDAAHRLLRLDGLAPAGSEVLLGGYGAHREELVQLSRSDLLRAEQVGLPIVLVVLLLTFGALWATVVPLAIGLAALLCGLGTAGALAFGIPFSEYVTNAATMVGLALAVDYAMFLVQRVREALLRGAGVDEAVRGALRTTGVAILWSGITVLVALATMLLIDARAMRTAGIGMVLVTFWAVVAALVAAPLVLRLLGHRILRRADRARLAGRAAAGEPAPEGEVSRFWLRWGRLVTGRPVLSLAAGVAVLGALSLPVLDLSEKVDLPTTAQMPADSQVRRATEIGARAFGPGVFAPVEIVVRGTADTAGVDAGRVVEAVGAHPEVLAARPLPLATPDVVRVSVVTANAPSDDRTHALVESLRDGDLSRSLAGVRYEVGGEAAMRIDAKEALFGGLPLMLAVLLVLVLGLLMVAMRSIVLPVKAALLVVISLGASTGGLLLLSTTAPGARLIGWSDPADLHPIVPITIVAVVVALATDYEVVLIARITERYRETGDNTASIVAGVAGTGRVISSAAAIMIAVFFGFALSEVTPLKQLGVGLAIAVLIDATLIRGVLVPASMQLMGRWNWWLPSFAGRPVAPAPPGRPGGRAEPAGGPGAPAADGGRHPARSGDRP